MKRNLLGLVATALAGALLAADPAAAQSVLSFTYTDSAGAIDANFTLDVSGGNATFASGTITSSQFTGTDTISLITNTTVLPAGSGTINNLGCGLPSCVTWANIPGTGGTNLSGDTVVNASGSPQYFDSNGIILAFQNSSGAYVGGLNIWGAGGTVYQDGFASGSQTNYGTNGVLTLNAVPEPDTYAMMIAGLGAVGLTLRRRRSAA